MTAPYSMGSTMAAETLLTVVLNRTLTQNKEGKDLREEGLAAAQNTTLILLQSRADAEQPVIFAIATNIRGRGNLCTSD